ncbi:MAG: FtsW/RodA/SpoVE family cell cycle protein [Candidatus Saccharimonas sp.]
MGLLMILGVVVMYAIGPQRANVLNNVHNTDFYTANYFVIKQAVSLAIACTAFWLMAIVVPFEFLKKHSIRLLQIGFGLCALLFVGGNILHIDQVAVNTLGAYRWFNLGPLGTFQPAEVLKFALLIFLAGFLGKRYGEGKINDLKHTIYPAGIMIAASLFVIVVLQKDMGTGVSLASMAMAMFVMSTMKWKIMAKILGICLAAGVLLIVTSPHRMERIGTFFSGDSAAHGNAEADDNNYHIKNAMIALGSGGMFGRGIGQSIQATGYLPEAVNDSIFAIMGEIFGFVGTTVIVGLFAGLMMRLLRIADHLEDMSMRLAVAGVFGWLAAHVVMNIASMIGMVPLTGITLPLLSSGGSSIIFLAGALGLALQLSRLTAHHPVILKEESDEDSRSGRRLGRTRYASRRRT